MPVSVGGLRIRARDAVLVLGAVTLCGFLRVGEASSPDVRLIEDVRWDTKRDIELSELTEASPSIECDQTAVRFDPSNRGFHFDDGEGAACSEVRFTVNFTGDVREAELRFRADRRIVSGTAYPAAGISFRERLYAYNESMERIDERVIFATTDPSEEFRDFSFRFAVPAGAARMTLAWFLHDMNGTQASRYSSTIEVPSLRLVDQELPAPDESTLNETVTNKTRSTIIEANVSLPSTWQADDRGSLRITVDETVSLLQVMTPLGEPLNGTFIDETHSRGQKTLQISNALLGELGHPYYRFQFKRDVPANNEIPGLPRPTIYWLAYAALVCPVLPLPGAARASWKYWQETRLARSQRSIPLAATGAVAATYLVILTLAANQRLVPQMGRLPLSASATSVYTMMLLLFAIGIAIWLLAGRVLLIHVRLELAENRRLVTELERSNQDLQQFAYAASHDLREPLRAISGYSSLLEAQGKELTAESRGYVAKVRESTARMNALINALLQFAKVQSSRESKKSVNLEDVLSDAKQALAAVIEEKGATITHDPLPAVAGDAAQLVSVFQNLLSNAIKFHGPSTIPAVHVTSAREDGRWRIMVQDNGIGIDPQHSERLFTLFGRLHSRAAYPGTGIGLATAKRIIERHGGQVGFESQVGEGSVFWFTLPTNGPEPKT